MPHRERHASNSRFRQGLCPKAGMIAHYRAAARRKHQARCNGIAWQQALGSMVKHPCNDCVIPLVHHDSVSYDLHFISYVRQKGRMSTYFPNERREVSRRCAEVGEESVRPQMIKVPLGHGSRRRRARLRRGK